MEYDGSDGKQCHVCGMLFPPDTSIAMMRSHGYKCRGAGPTIMPVNAAFTENQTGDGRRRRSAVKAMHSFAQGHCGDLDADLDYGDDDERLQIPVDETEDDPSFVPDEVMVKVEEEDDYEYQDDNNALEEDTDSGQSEEEFVSEMDDDVLQGKRKTPRVKKTAEDGGTIREFPNDAHSILTKYLEMQYAWERRLDPRTVRIVYFKHFASQWKNRSERPDLRLDERRHLFVPNPAAWTPIPENQVLKYLPTERNSMRYQTPGNSMKQLNLFEVDKEESMWFTGGFVRAMAWNPQTFKDGFQKAQYLAVATYRDVTSVQPYLDVKTSVGMVQIWECKQLSVEETGVPPSPRLALGLGHSFGKVLALTWLSPFSAASCHEQPHHLGTLALAATDGVVHLLPIALPNGGAATSESSVFYTSSQWLSLGIPPTAIDPNALQRFGFPTCVESRPEFPHLIVAGYNTGYVAMWSLTTFCPWLEEYKYIPSIRCFRGTNGPMFSVALDPLSGRNILCAGHERPLKLWHIDDPSQSHIAWAQQRAGSCRAFSWAGRGDLVCSVHEDNYGAVQAGVYLQAVHAPQKVSLRVTEHQGAARDCSFSDLLSSLVFSTQEGLVSAIPIGRHLYDTRACREFAKSKPAFTVMSLSLKEIQNATVFPGQTQGCGRCGQTNNYAMCYRCVEAKYVLDINRTNGSDKTSLTYHLWQSQAVTRVAFNPNPAACTWLAFGTAGGLVRIERVDRLMYSEMRDFLKCLCEQPDGVSVASLSNFVDQSLATQQQSRRNVGGRSRKKAGGPVEEEEVNSQDTESTLPAVEPQLDLTPASTPCVHKERSLDDRISVCSQDSVSTVPCLYEDGREQELLSDMSPVPTPPPRRGGRGGSRRGACRGRGRGGAKTPVREGSVAAASAGQRRRGGSRGRRKTAIEVVMEAIGVGSRPHELEAELPVGQVSQISSSDTCRSIPESNVKEGGEEGRVDPDPLSDAPAVAAQLPQVTKETGEKDEDETPPLSVGLPEADETERADSEAPSVEYDIPVQQADWESDGNETAEKTDDSILAVGEAAPISIEVPVAISDEAAKMQEIVEVPTAGEVSVTSEKQEATEVQEVEEVTQVQEVQETLQGQEVHQGAEMLDVEEAPEVQEVQETAEVHEVQEAPEVEDPDEVVKISESDKDTEAPNVAGEDVEKRVKAVETEEGEHRACEVEITQATPKRRRGRPAKLKPVGEEKKPINQTEPDSTSLGDDGRDVAAGSRDRKLRSAGRPQELNKWREPTGRQNTRPVLSDDGASSQSSRRLMKNPPPAEASAPRRSRHRKQPEAGAIAAATSEFTAMELQAATATTDSSAAQLKAPSVTIASPDFAPEESKVIAASPHLPVTEVQGVTAVTPDVKVSGKRGRPSKSRTLAAATPPLKRRRKSNCETTGLTSCGDGSTGDQSAKEIITSVTKAEVTPLNITGLAGVNQCFNVVNEEATEPADLDLTPPLPDEVVQTNALEMAKSVVAIKEMEDSQESRERNTRGRRQRSSSKNALHPPDVSVSEKVSSEKGEAPHMACDPGSTSEMAVVETTEKESLQVCKETLDVSHPSDSPTAVMEVMSVSKEKDESGTCNSTRSSRRGRPKAKDADATADEVPADVKSTTSIPSEVDITAAEMEKTTNQSAVAGLEKGGRRRRTRQPSERAKSEEDLMVVESTSTAVVTVTEDVPKTENTAGGRRRARSSVENAKEKTSKDESLSVDVEETGAKTSAGRKTRRQRPSLDKRKADDPPILHDPKLHVSDKTQSENFETIVVVAEEMTGAAEHVRTTTAEDVVEKIATTTAVDVEKSSSATTMESKGSTEVSDEEKTLATTSFDSHAKTRGATTGFVEDKTLGDTAVTHEKTPATIAEGGVEKVPATFAFEIAEKTLEATTVIDEEKPLATTAVDVEKKTYGTNGTNAEEKLSTDSTTRRRRQPYRRSEDVEGVAEEVVTLGSTSRSGRRQRLTSEKEKKVEVDNEINVDHRQSDAEAAGPEVPKSQENSQSTSRFPRRRRQSTEKGDEFLQHIRSSRSGRQKTDGKNVNASELPPSTLVIDVEPADIRSSRRSRLSSGKIEEVIILDSPPDESSVPDAGTPQEEGLSRSTRRQRLSTETSKKSDDVDTPAQPLVSPGRSGRRGRQTRPSAEKDSSPPTPEETDTACATAEDPVVKSSVGDDDLGCSSAQEVKTSILSPPATDTDGAVSLHDTSSDANTLTPAPDTKEDPEGVEAPAHLTLRPRTMTKSGVRCLQPVAGVQEVPMVDLTLISDSESDAQMLTPTEVPSRARARQRELELVKGKPRRVRLVTIEWVEGKWSGVRQPVPSSHLEGTPVEGGLVHVRWPRRSSKRKWAARVVSISFTTRSRSSSNTSTGPAESAVVASPDPEIQGVSQKSEPDAAPTPVPEPKTPNIKVTSPQDGESSNVEQTSAVESKESPSTPESKPKSPTKMKSSRNRASSTAAKVEDDAASPGETSSVPPTPESTKAAAKAKSSRKRASPETESDDNAPPPIKRLRPPATTTPDKGPPKQSPPKAKPHFPAAAKVKAKAVKAVRKKEADVAALEPMAKRSRAKKVEAVDDGKQQRPPSASSQASAGEKTMRRARPSRVSAAEEGSVSAEDGSKLLKKQGAKKG